MVIFERVTPPHGSKMSDNDLQLIFSEYELAESEFKKPTVNRRFWRQLGAIIHWLTKYGITILLVVGVGALVVYQLFSPGGMFGGT